MKHYFLTLRHNGSPSLHFTSRKDALKAAREFLGGRVFTCHEFTTDHGQAVCLYGTRTERDADQTGAYAVRLEWNTTGVRP